jgi:uncharacterized protein (TIGR02594 family)
MQSNLKSLTSMLLVASAIALVGASSPAHARRHVPERTLTTESPGPWLMEGTQRWNDMPAYDSVSRMQSVRSSRHQARRSESTSNALEPQDSAWHYPDTDFAATTEPSRRRRGRVASLGRNSVAGSQGAGSDLVAEARRWIGTNPTGWASVWCGRFMNFVLERTGHHGSGSNLARSFASYGSRIGGPQIGAIAVMGRSGRAAGGSAGGHVGIVSGIDSQGNPIIISGNHGHRVAEAVYPRGRIYAYVMP